jgi:Bacterial type II/III secretion system short domain
MPRRFYRLYCSLLLLSLAMAWPCQAEIKVLALKHVAAEEIVPVVRDVLEGQGKVSTWDNRLIINASAEEIATIEEVLQQIDLPPTMLLISLRQENRKGQAGTRAILSNPPASGMAGAGVSEATAGAPDGAAKNPFSSTGARYLGNTAEQTTQTLRLRDGSKGFILMGERVPYVREMLLLARRYAGYGQTVEFQAVNTGFWVRPILERGYATLEIRPHLEGFQRSSSRMMGMPSAVQLQELVSTVRVPLGQWVDLGHHLREGDEVSRAILTWRTSNLQQERTVWIKVDR